MLQRLIVLLAAVATLSAAVRLGMWQLDRASQKTALQQTLDVRRALPPLQPEELASDVARAQTQHHRSIRLSGTWLPEHTVYLENRQMRGRPGFVAVTPLRLSQGNGNGNGNGDAVLVQRGWLARDSDDRTRIMLPALPGGPVVVQGRIAPPPPRLYEFDAAASGAIRQNLDVPAFAAETGLALRPLSVLQEAAPEPLTRAAAGPPADGLLRDWPVPAAGVDKHLGYAFQWFALGALVVVLYVWFQIVRPRRREPRSGA